MLGVGSWLLDVHRDHGECWGEGSVHNQGSSLAPSRFLVHLLQLAPLAVRQQSLPGPFGVAHHQGVEMRRGVLRAQGGVVAASDQDPAPPAKLGRDLIRPRRQRRHECDADDVAIRIEVQRLDVLVHDSHLVFARGESRHYGQRQDAEAEHRPARHFGLVWRHANLLAGRQDQQDLQRCPSRTDGQLFPGNCAG